MLDRSELWSLHTKERMILGSAVVSPLVESTSSKGQKPYILNLRGGCGATGCHICVVEYQMKDRCHYSDLRQCMVWLLQIFGSSKGRAREPISFSGLERRKLVV